MATGTSNTEIDDLKEMVRVLTNRVDILSAANTDLNTKLVKAKEVLEAQTADLNARLVKSQEQVRDMERSIFASRKESDKITLPAWPTTQGFARWRESVLAVTVAASALATASTHPTPRHPRGRTPYRTGAAVWRRPDRPVRHE